MPYDILSDDVVDKDDNQPRRGGGKDHKIITISPLMVHILLIILLGIIVLVLYFVLFSGPGNSDIETEEQITLIGDLSSFNKTYSGDLSFSSGSFTLETDNSILQESSQNVKVENFNGSIYLFNKSIYFVGSANQISFNKNTINLEGDPFQIISPRRTNIDVFLDEAHFEFEEGRVKVDNGLNLEFKEGYVGLDDYNVSIAYDGVFSMSGTANTFNLSAPNQKLEITYDSSR